MSAHPRTDALKLDPGGAAGLMLRYDVLCRTLEDENAQLRQRIAALEAEDATTAMYAAGMDYLHGRDTWHVNGLYQAMRAAAKR